MPSRTRAAALVRAGAVRVDGTVATRPALPVSSATEVTLDAPDRSYVSRAAYKLAGALDALEVGASHGRPAPPVVAGARCLDVGASTGGFTQVLLERGAAGVIALDVGHGQLDSTLRGDPRVHVIEGCNARELQPEALPYAPTVVVADLSFISLRLVLPALVRAAPRADLLLMVKPQFEVGRERLGRDGVVRTAAAHESAVLDVVTTAVECGLRLVAVAASSLPGPSGNREFFCWFQRSAARGTASVQEAVRAAVADAAGRTAYYPADADAHPEAHGGNE
ncbi:16S/23S rRNA (cytidine-2'-O)-methyltransferase TlyA [Flavimobilis marinus]|uniref:23S rRNA (Cytidine1920-2'-O)/16S rRNA (Cytidine1409-2'-O)-methyltransferase n=1 Tax=Flavimobilis marinus TaxID=285351 RepID=A0A1I2EXT4_9MICO|nr:16S/23S rRNA (cytidine-2'-O)-methyltransferase TlyA [Flavimobilis marinus]SFE97944.1 23S rRNA (cytidine1920-2'-O)/16S rRNA (cytidine1409-2'-O)-methyltransferase [Flavimobilis marinus]